MINKPISTMEQLSFYNENGYLILDTVFTSEECDIMLENMYHHATDEFAAIMNPDRFEFLVAQTLENISSDWNLLKKLKYIDKCKKTVKIVSEMMKSPNIVDILELIQGKEVVGLMSQMLFKEAGSAYATQAWTPHQDNTYPRNPNGQYITTNIFFKDSNKDNGSLYIYPGSHTDGLFISAIQPSYRESIGSNPGNTISEEVLNRFEKVDCSFKKGDLLVLHGNVIHGSFPNYSDQSRPLLSCSYITKGEEFIPGKNAQRKIINLH